MREILFKAKRISDGKWIEGYYFKAKWHWHEKGIHEDWLLVSATQNGGRCNINQRYAIDGKTLCQYTGLTDKNGKKIWENDIIKHDFGEDQIGVQYALVIYSDKYATYRFEPINNWMYCDKSDCEVIGNIFDNPELVEEVQNEDESR